MTRRAATAWTAAGAAVVAGVLSLTRILLTNPHALSNLVWAEDGLFPLCVREHGVLSCTVEPYAGYLPLLHRLIAWPVSLTPIDDWPLATNLAAAVLAAIAALLAVLILRASGVGAAAAAFVATLPVLAPIVGFETINVYSSSYMLLTYVVVLALCFPPPGRFPTWAYAIGAAVSALTIPSTVVVLLPLAVQIARRRIPLRDGIVVGVVLAAGIAVQAWVALTAPARRVVNLSLDSLRAWADAVPDALLGFVPKQAWLTAQGTLETPFTHAWGVVGTVVVVIVIVGGTALLFLPDRVANGMGLMVLSGLALGAIPAVAGYANNRYFVIPAVLWLGAVMIGLDLWLTWHPHLVTTVVASVIVIAWIPSLPAANWRAQASPEWGPMIAQAHALCAEYPTGTASLTFTPSWPFPDAEFPGLTSNEVDCTVLAR